MPPAASFERAARRRSASGTTGYLALMLHAHLPYVRHPEHDDFLEEDWLYEAITETYVPLLRMFERLDAEGVPFRLTMGVTPPLAAMLGDELLIGRYRRHLGRLRSLAAREVDGHPPDTTLGRLARFYQSFLDETAAWFEQRWGSDLLAALRDAQARGSVELVTSTATHGYLPLMSSDTARRAQVRIGSQAYREVFGRPSRGIWLGECAYQPGVDALLREEGIDYFFVDSHALERGDPRPAWGVWAPVQTRHGAHALARDSDATRQVWSAREGYPGDPSYREFYRDLGYDAGYSYIRPYLHADGVRRSVGLKYYRVTGDVPLHHKAYWDPEVARQRAAEHAAHFLASRRAQAHELGARLGGLDRPPLVVAPYDAELFGHWWFEGPWFLEFLIRQAAFDQSDIELVTPGDYLDRHPRVQQVEPSFSSWGAEGYARVWLNAGNAAMYRHQHVAERRMVRLAHRFAGARGATREALNQAARELLLAQSSDWAFIITNATAVPYAVKRFREHLTRFHGLADAVESGRVQQLPLAEMFERMPLFPWIDSSVYAEAAS